jgi:hypothetical protein
MSSRHSEVITDNFRKQEALGLMFDVEKREDNGDSQNQETAGPPLTSEALTR